MSKTRSTNQPKSLKQGKFTRALTKRVDQSAEYSTRRVKKATQDALGATIGLKTGKESGQGGRGVKGIVKTGRILKCGLKECQEVFEEIIVAGNRKAYHSSRCKFRDWDRRNPRIRENSK